MCVISKNGAVESAEVKLKTPRLGDPISVDPPTNSAVNLSERSSSIRASYACF